MLVHADDSNGLKKLSWFHRQLQIMSIHNRLNISQFQIGFGIPCLIAIHKAGLVNSIHLVSGKDTGGPIWFSLIFVLGAFDVFLMVIFVFGVL